MNEGYCDVLGRYTCTKLHGVMSQETDFFYDFRRDILAS
jgi:hypothetical protein